ncbi:2-keto-3-deoxy-galactonokinase [Vibrio sp. HA2012]|uniref:2-dehydro-3-deoxygalactonokinase n=1 Tax=Vibrio sp. HA2012 TaxID=1971595 RepID=UPI000C2C2F31|nr:2-dehydro-3-deoxygalactonokinase [Vibrio sp. HA2012]PJC85847.1 2-keto-3-deoxy-galactonokinase [Vibrio sp. HA2012]
MSKFWIAVDWGTTNFRAFLMDDSGQCMAEKSAPLGLLAVENQQFSQALKDQLGDWSKTTSTIYMAGMIGSKQGWLEAPYVNLPADHANFLQSCVEVEQSWADSIKIIAGATCLNKLNLPEVMRGEEVQLIGLANLVNSPKVSAILHGTHSKHAQCHYGEITKFSTFMTGELFNILVKNSILGINLPAQEDSESVFNFAVKLGFANSINEILFSARTNRLFGGIKDSQVHDYISGMLIGNEISALNKDETHYLIGSESLSKKYASALASLGYQYEIVSGKECFLNGMYQIYLKESR